MKKKWKYDKLIALHSVISLHSVFTGVVIVFMISSCNQKDKHQHIPTNKTSELDGLAQPTNQTVFSDVKIISPIKKSITPIIDATGVITYDPRLVNNISARFSGRIEKLYVRFNFENVSKGQRIMDIYSPEILTEQENLIYLLKGISTDVTLINSTKQKLQLLGLTVEQLKEIETTKRPVNPVPIYSPYSGHIHDIGVGSGVASSESSMNNGMNSRTNNGTNSSSQELIEKLPASQTAVLTIKEGMYVQSGQPVFDVYDIYRVWAMLNIFPQDAALIKIGDKVSITAETNPTHVILSSINYLEPVAGQNASTVKARVYLQNAENLHLKIGALLSAKITSTEIKGMWLPRKAVVNLGQKHVVFIKTENHFKTKIIQTGIVADSLIQIISGLTGDEAIAANAQFMVDSESFIQTEDNGQ
jgi:Cu(I)/Ag(I) efflux system membrane fusion protein